MLASPIGLSVPIPQDMRVRRTLNCSQVEFLSAEEMKTEVTNFPDLEDCPEDVVEELAQDLLRPLTQQFQEVARGVFLATLNAESGEGRRRTHQQLQDKVSALLTTIKLSEKSLKVNPNFSICILCHHILTPLN